MAFSQAKKRDDVEPYIAVLARQSELQEDVKTIGQAQQTDIAAIAAQRQIRELASCAWSITLSQDGNDALTSIVLKLSALTRLCDQKFVTFSYSSIPPVWRAIYIDAQLLQACCALKRFFESGTKRSATLRRCIRDLDLALIIAGAACTSKGQHCHDLIRALQIELLEAEPEAASEASRSPRHHAPLRKRFKGLQGEGPSPRPSSSTQADLPVREFSFQEAPSFTDLAEQNLPTCSRPFIVRAYAQSVGWHAVQSGDDGSVPGSWSSLEHLLQVAGPGRVVPVEVGASYTQKEWGQDVMLWSDFLHRIRWDRPDQLLDRGADRADTGSGSDAVVLYMAQHGLPGQFPTLEQDYTLPDYVYTSPSALEDWPDYKPPATTAGCLTSLWIGPANTVSPPHYDPYYNCFVQAVGYKEIWLAPPHCRPCTVSPSPNQTPAADRTDQVTSTGPSHIVAERETVESIADSLMTNTANIDVFGTLDQVPLFVRAAASKAVLGPGDLLYMPPGWWHSLRSLTRSFSVSTWY